MDQVNQVPGSAEPQAQAPEVKKDAAPAQVQDTTSATAAQAEESEQDRNWKKFREQREIERKQLEAEKKRASEKEKEAAALKAAMDSLLNKPEQRNGSQREEVDYFEDDEEKRIEKLVEKKMQEKERAFEETRRQRETQEMPDRLRQAHQDFDQICTPDNLDYLEYHYPEIAGAFGHMPNGIEKWTSVYKAVKRLVPNTDGKRTQAQAEKNLARPQAGAGSQAGQGMAPTHLSEDRRAANWARMQKVLRGIN